MPCDACPSRATCRAPCAALLAELPHEGSGTSWRLRPLDGRTLDRTPASVPAPRARSLPIVAWRAQLATALPALTVEERDVATARFAGTPFHEIARVRGVSVPSVFKTWRRACARLEQFAKRPCTPSALIDADPRTLRWVAAQRQDFAQAPAVLPRRQRAVIEAVVEGGSLRGAAQADGRTFPAVWRSYRRGLRTLAATLELFDGRH